MAECEPEDEPFPVDVAGARGEPLEQVERLEPGPFRAVELPLVVLPLVVLPLGVPPRGVAPGLLLHLPRAPLPRAPWHRCPSLRRR